ncbi:MAG TPA: type I secretion system permease/ATPase [Sphingomicrobium sp.]
MLDRRNDNHRILDPDALRQPIRNAILGSLCINVLALATPLYMLVIYDRVMTSRSGSTLLAVTLATIITLALLATLDLFRNMVFARTSATLYAELEARIYAACRRWALGGGSARRVRPLEDLEVVRSFLASPAPAALLDIIFVPLFLAVLFVMHSALGVVTSLLIGAIVILALINKRAMARTTESSTERFREACDFAEAHWRQVEPSIAMGYAGRGERRAAQANREAIKAQSAASSTTGSITSIIKGVRQGSQILIIAVATYLALEGEVTMGAIIASSILFSRALMPIDQLVGAWRMLFQTRGAWKRLHDMLAGAPEAQSPMPLLRPTGEITAADLVACAPGSSDPILKGVGFALAAGESMAVIGPSGAGKSTLAKVVLGIWPTVRGTVRLDGADMAQMDVDRLGEHFGYLPQSVELLPGTIAENIRRLRDDDPDGVIDAAQRAGAHEMILGLPKGYDTVVGARGFGLSGGQLQRVALARALYGRPMIVLLDEPDADLDQTGERGLVNAMELLRREKVTLIVIAHRSFLVQQLDKLLVMNGGQVVKFGTMDEFVSPEAAKSVRVVR